MIFYSNGYDHWLWDDASYPPRAVQGFYKKDELALLIQRRDSRKPLADATINEAIVERFYQLRAIRRICEAFERDHDRKTLVVMATGAGKTRTVSFERFRAKARAFLGAHEDHIAIHKLRMNKPLTKADLGELERMLVASEVGGFDDLYKAKAQNNGLGLFVRSLVGLDREAAKQSFAGFLAGKTLSAKQIEFVNLVIDHLTERGVMEPALLYESPFTDLNDQSSPARNIGKD